MLILINTGTKEIGQILCGRPGAAVLKVTQKEHVVVVVSICVPGLSSSPPQQQVGLLDVTVHQTLTRITL